MKVIFRRDFFAPNGKLYYKSKEPQEVPDEYADKLPEGKVGVNPAAEVVEAAKKSKAK